MDAETILKSIGYDNDSITITEKWIAKELYLKYQHKSQDIKKSAADIANHPDFEEIEESSPLGRKIIKLVNELK